MKLEWSVFALGDRDGIFDFIEVDSPRSAIRVDSAIEVQAERLIDFPESGRPGRIAGTREVIVGQLPYVIAYRVTSDKVRILRVLHCAQQWPDSLPQ